MEREGKTIRMSVPRRRFTTLERGLFVRITDRAAGLAFILGKLIRLQSPRHRVAVYAQTASSSPPSLRAFFGIQADRKVAFWQFIGWPGRCTFQSVFLVQYSVLTVAWEVGGREAPSARSPAQEG